MDVGPQGEPRVRMPEKTRDDGQGEAGRQPPRCRRVTQRVEPNPETIPVWKLRLAEEARYGPARMIPATVGDGDPCDADRGQECEDRVISSYPTVLPESPGGVGDWRRDAVGSAWPAASRSDLGCPRSCWGCHCHCDCRHHVAPFAYGMAGPSGVGQHDTPLAAFSGPRASLRARRVPLSADRVVTP